MTRLSFARIADYFGATAPNDPQIELSKNFPNLVDEWNDTVKNHGEKS